MTFSQKVWALTRKIPRGKVSTYGEIARAMNCRAYQAVGNALNKNPYICGGIVEGCRVTENEAVPCHRVVCSDGRIGGFARGAKEKIRMLKAERVLIKNNRIINFDKKKYCLSDK